MDLPENIANGRDFPRNAAMDCRGLMPGWCLFEQGAPRSSGNAVVSCEALSDHQWHLLCYVARLARRNAGRRNMRVCGWRGRLGTVGCLFLTGLIGVLGCQGSWPVAGSTPFPSNSQFMEGWTTYLHCRLSREPDDIRRDVEALSRMAYRVATQSRPSAFLPASMRGLVMNPPSRLAVDPQAMMVACAQHGGEVAHGVGRPELAVELFTVALAVLREQVYVYHPKDSGDRAFINRE